jgi:hypothetical protein
VKSIWAVPRNLEMTSPPAGVTQAWALGYSGWLGVPASSVDHVGSPIVASLPSVSPARMAVIGRQKA